CALPVWSTTRRTSQQRRTSRYGLGFETKSWASLPFLQSLEVLFLRGYRCIPASQIGWLHAFDEAAEAERGRLIRSDEADVVVRADAGVKTSGPEARVDDQPAETVVEQILRRAVRGREDPSRFAGGAGVGPNPRYRHLFLVLRRGRVRPHAVEDFSHRQD